MFNKKEKIGFQIFINRFYLPLIIETVDNQADLLQDEINKNLPPITFSKDQTKFESAILLLKVSGYGLSQVNGIEQFSGQLAQLEDDFLNSNFSNVELNPKLLVDREEHSVFSDRWLYMSNKAKAYAKYEQLYQQDKIRKEDFPFIISSIFFAHFCRFDNVNASLAHAIGELHKGGLIYFHQKLATLANVYQVMPDNQ